jgi:putative endopeptidase
MNLNLRRRVPLAGAAIAIALATGYASPLAAQGRALGIDTAGMDRNVRPQDDFYNFVNGGWQRTAQIPGDRSATGAFITLTDASEAAVRRILDAAMATRNAAPGSDVQKMGDLYASYLDSAAIEAAGITPLRPDLARIDAVTSREQYPALFAANARIGVGSPFGVGVRQDGKQSDRYTVYANQGGLGLPDREYYLSQNAPQVAIRAAYVTYLTTLFQLSGQPDPAGSAQRVLALETQLAQRQWDRVRSRDRNATYNKMTVAEAQRLTPNFAWAPYLAALGLRTDEVIVSQPSYFQGADSVLAGASVDDVKAYARARLLDNSAAFLSSPFANAQFQFRGRTLQGLREQRPRWKRGTDVVEGSLGQMVGKAYVEQNFPASSKAAMQRLVGNLLASFRSGIDSLAWMSAETRAQAKDKLDHITVKIGYPDRWQDYSALTITRGSLFANLRAVAAYQYNRAVNRLGQPVDRSEWGMTPQTVNAYYNPANNEIVFPAAILQPPFFDAEADDAVNYGGIGAVIGHEIGHGFDDQGSKYDGDGRLEDWWTADDRAEFESRTKALIDQYSEFSPVQLNGSHHVNGELTIGENIGDLGGLSIAFTAYRIALGTPLEDAPVIDGLTGAQRVLLGWAQVWQAMGRDEEMIRRIAMDPHSPNEFRCNGVVRNVDEFYAAFDVQPGDALYLAPEERVRIW